MQNFYDLESKISWAKEKKGNLYILSIELDSTLRIVIDMPSMISISQKELLPLIIELFISPNFWNILSSQIAP